MSGVPMGMVVSILCADTDPQAFCRRLVTTVNHGPMHLTRVVASGMQVYPVRADTFYGTATLLRCEFRRRNTGTPITGDDVRALFDRLGSFEVLDSHFVDAHGVNLGPVVDIAAAS